MGRVLVWIGGIFASLGVVFVSVAGWAYLRDQSFAEAGLRAQGRVIELIGSRDNDDGYTYAPVVEFRDADGLRHVFVSSVSSNPPQYATGEAVDVIYAANSPDEAIIDGFVDRFLFPLIFGGLGTVFAAIGFGLLFARLRARQIAAQLRASGLPIQAKVVECYRDTSVTVNGRSPWRLLCQANHPATGIPHSFKSDAFWIDPGAGLAAGSSVRVFVDPARPDRYLVDLSTHMDESAIG